MGNRVILAFAILVADFITIGIPLAALFLAYVLLARPKWLERFVRELYKS